MASHERKQQISGQARSPQQPVTGQLRDEDLERVAGGIETVPLPEAKLTKKKKPAKKKMADL
jgi:hypothetical protein